MADPGGGCAFMPSYPKPVGGADHPWDHPCEPCQTPCEKPGMSEWDELSGKYEWNMNGIVFRIYEWNFQGYFFGR